MKYIVNCQHCSKEFEGKRSTAAYCSPSCRQMAYVKRSNQQYQPKSQLINQSVNQLADQRQSTLPLISVNKTIDTVNLPSIIEGNTTVIPSTNEAYTGSYRQSTVNNYHQQNKPEPVNIRSFIQQLDLKDANQKLKRWVEDLLEFDANRKIYIRDISDLSYQLESFLLNDMKKLPPDYPYYHFILYVFKPRIDKLSNWKKKDRQPYFDFQIVGDFKEKLMKVMKFLK